MASLRCLDNTNIGDCHDSGLKAGASRSGASSGHEPASAFPSLVYTPKDRPLDQNTVWETDLQAGETVSKITSGKGFKALKDHREQRAERWALKSAAGRLLPRDHRTSKCHNFRLPNREREVMRGGEQQRAFYHGMQVCARVWTCPVCASKISERRRDELAGAIAVAQSQGLKVYLLTLTVPHGLGDDVNVILDQMMCAWSKLNQTRLGRKTQALVGLSGTVRVLEVTYGENGFHPHFHALLFLDTGLTPEGVQAAYSTLWQSCAVKAGLPLPSDLRGCRVDDGAYAAAYVSKGSSWGLESELTKGHQKRGKNGSRTPWDLLRDYLEGDRRSGALWRVYADAFQGRRQLVWSKGLKKRLTVVDITDEELANKPDEVASALLAQISNRQWKAIRALHFQSAVLDLAEADPDALRSFLASLTIEVTS